MFFYPGMSFSSVPLSLLPEKRFLTPLPRSIRLKSSVQRILKAESLETAARKRMSSLRCPSRSKYALYHEAK